MPQAGGVSFLMGRRRRRLHLASPLHYTAVSFVSLPDKMPREVSSFLDDRNGYSLPANVELRSERRQAGLCSRVLNGLRVFKSESSTS
jgi:hypothetical protein